MDEVSVNNSQFITFPSPAKLNLFLHIVGQRENGYHNLETVFQFLDYGDSISIKVTSNGEIRLLTPIKGVKNQDNLIVKAATLLQKHSSCALGVDIKVTKVLPIGGGLGGGSSNAATVLLALNKLWQTNLATTELAALALELGADVPVFIHGFSAFAQGIGEKLTPVYPKEYWYLVCKPNCSISTASVFSSEDLPRNTPNLAKEFYDNIDLDACHNDCQTMVIKHYPEVAKLLDWLAEYAPSRMTGTGACIFSRFGSETEALLVQSQLPDGITSFVAKGLNTSPVHDALGSTIELKNE